MTTRIEALKIKVGSDITAALDGFDKLAAKAKAFGDRLSSAGRTLTRNVRVVPPLGDERAADE